MVELQRPANSVTAADETRCKLSIQLRVVRLQLGQYPGWPDCLRGAVWPRTTVLLARATQSDRRRLAHLHHLPMARRCSLYTCDPVRCCDRTWLRRGPDAFVECRLATVSRSSGRPKFIAPFPGVAWIQFSLRP